MKATKTQAQGTYNFHMKMYNLFTSVGKKSDAEAALNAANQLKKDYNL